MTQAKPKTDAPDDLTREEQKRLWGWVQSKAHPPSRPRDPFFMKLVNNRKLVRYHVDTCLKWHRDNKVKCSDFARACENWIAKAALQEEERRSTEQPQMTQTRGRDFSPLTDTLKQLTLDGEGD